MFTIDPGSGRKIRLLNVTEVVPPKFQFLFPFETFNRIQTAIFPLVFNTDKNLVVATPTGSGKTVIGELAIARALEKKKPALYLSPLRAISYEKEETWSERFGSQGYKVTVITGETELDRRELINADIILSTTEKWDSLSRNSQNHFLVERLGVMVIDEVHLLDDSERGGTLEVVVSRMKRLASNCRIIALSATLPGAKEIGSWLNAEILEFGSEYRPAKLNIQIYPYNQGSNPFADKYRRIYRCLDISRKYLATGDQILIFVASRGDTYLAAKKVMQLWQERDRTPLQPQEYRRLQAVSEDITSPLLKNVLRSGLAFHNAGLSKKDRKQVEELFRQGLIKMLFSTSTLAWGVNLPAKVVIIRDIVLQDPLKGEIKISTLDLHQMLGRAGRPQYDKEGFGYILVPEEQRQRYHRLLKDMRKIDTHILDQLEEHLNAEIQLETIKSEKDAELWFQNLFLGTRMQNDPSLAVKAEKVFQRALSRLLEEGFVTKEADHLKGSTLGKLTSIFYLKLETAVLFHEFANRSESDAITALARAEEFKEVIFRRSERKALKDALTYYPSSFLKELSPGQRKVLGILQTILTGGIIDQSMATDARILIQNCLRLLAALRAFVREFVGETDRLLDLIFLELQLKHQQANIDYSVLLQVPGLGKNALNKLIEHDISNIHTLKEYVENKGLKGLQAIGIRKDYAEEIVQTTKTLPPIIIEAKIPESFQKGPNLIPIHIELPKEYWTHVRIRLNNRTMLYERTKTHRWDFPLELQLKPNQGYQLEIMTVIETPLILPAMKTIPLSHSLKVTPSVIVEESKTSITPVSPISSKIDSTSILEIPSGTIIIAKGLINLNVDKKSRFIDRFTINFPTDSTTVLITATNRNAMYKYPITDAVFTADESLLEIESTEGSIKIKIHEIEYTDYKDLLKEPSTQRPIPVKTPLSTKRQISTEKPPLELDQVIEKPLNAKCKNCGSQLNWIKKKSLVVCPDCSENYKIPTNSQLIEEQCDRCGLPMVSITQLYSLKICVDRTCQNMDDVIRMRFENEGYKCPNCKGALKVLRRRGLIAGCTNYYHPQQPCQTAFSLPRNSLIIGQCTCGLPFIQLKTKSRCLNTSCEFNQKINHKSKD
ncbi:MAG: DEAD/DEAH box helicase [Candidatus Hermodarchaeota archaeon]